MGNHGLAVAAETVDEAEVLLYRVSRLLSVTPRQAPDADIAALQRLAVNSQYRLPEDASIHRVATDLTSCLIAAGGSLYPDHVIFLGKGSVIASPTDTALTIEEKLQEGMALPPAILFPGRGVLVLKEATSGALAMARCLADVTSRIPQGARLNYLTDEENAELLGWDAEKYRQTLNRAGQALQ